MLGGNAIEILIGLRDEASHKLSNIEKSTLRSAEALKKQGMAFMAMGAAGMTALGMVTRSGVIYAETIDKLAKQTGMTTDQVQKLKYAAEQEHLSFETLSKGIPVLTKYMSEAARGMETYKREFDNMGISVTDGEGNLKSAYEVLLEMSEYMGDDAVSNNEKLAVATKLMGRRGAELVPFLKMGREEIERLMQEAEKLGVIMSEENVTAGKKFGDSMLELTSPLKTMAFEIGMSLLPTFEKWLDKGKDLLKWFKDLSPETKSSIARFVLLGSAGLAAVGALMVIASVFKTLTVLGDPLFLKIMLIALAFDGVYRILSMLEATLGLVIQAMGKLFRIQGLQDFGNKLELLGTHGMEEGGLGMLMRESGLGELMPGGIGGLAKTMIGREEVGKTTKIDVNMEIKRAEEMLELQRKELAAQGIV